MKSAPRNPFFGRPQSEEIVVQKIPMHVYRGKEKANGLGRLFSSLRRDREQEAEGEWEKRKSLPPILARRGRIAEEAAHIRDEFSLRKAGA